MATLEMPFLLSIEEEGINEETGVKGQYGIKPIIR
jgi:hypothetical protein